MPPDGSTLSRPSPAGADLTAEGAAGLVGSAAGKDLRLDGLERLSVEAAAALAAHPGRLSLGGLTELSADLAVALAGHPGYLYLPGLKTISPEAARALAATRGHVECAGVVEITPQALLAVRATPRLKVPSQLKITAFIPAQPNMNAAMKGFFQDLGAALLLDRRFAEAAQCFERATPLDRSDPALHHKLGVSQAGAGQLEAAEASFREALRLDRFMAAYHSDLGHLLQRRGRREEAMVALRRALQLDPKCAAAHLNLGLLHEVEGRQAEALASIEAALALAPDNADAHATLAMLLLRQGDGARGWQEYEWRWLCPVFAVRALMHPRWQGEPLEGRTLLLTVEQGLGDTLQFIRYCPLAKKSGARVVLSCPRRLFRLLSTAAGIDDFVADDGPLPDFDCFTSLMSLPARFDARPEAIPRSVPYLAAEAARVARWADVLADLPGKKVGIVWQGNTSISPERSLTLEALEPLSRVPGISLVSLQQGPGRAELELVSREGSGWPRVVDAGGMAEEGDTEAAFVETAAVLKNLDLLVTCDTSIAHLAGALGIPVWVMLPHVADWRWLVDRDDSPWYPSMRLFRQPAAGDWPAVARRVAEALGTS